MKRAYDRPVGHWHFPTKLPSRHAVKCGNIFFVRMQVAEDQHGIPTLALEYLITGGLPWWSHD
jgi:hypothetical protein